MTGFVEELIDESLGASSKRWALIVFALALGALGALWYVGRGRDRSPQVDSAPAAPTPSRADDLSTLVGGATTQVASAWRKVSTPPAVMRKALTSNPITNRRTGPTSSA